MAERFTNWVNHGHDWKDSPTQGHKNTQRVKNVLNVEITQYSQLNKAKQIHKSLYLRVTASSTFRL